MLSKGYEMRYTSYERGWCTGLRSALERGPVMSSDDFVKVLADARVFLDDMDFIIIDAQRRAYVSAVDCMRDDTADTAPWRALPEWAEV